MSSYKDKFTEKLKEFITELNTKTNSDGIKKVVHLFDKLDMDQVIDKYHKSVKDHITQLKNKDMSLFDKSFIILPGVDMSEIFKNNNLSEKKKHRFITYMQLLAMLAEKVHMSKMDFNPYEGIGIDAKGFNLNKIASSINANIPEQKKKDGDIQSIPGLNMLAQASGLGQLLNGDELKKQLTDMTPEKINDMKQKMEEVMSTINGGADNNTTKTFTTMLDTIFDEIQNSDLKNASNPLDQVLNLAQKVSNKVENKIDPKDYVNLINSASKFAEEAKDENGNPLMSQFGGGNPMSFLSKFMEQQNGDK